MKVAVTGGSGYLGGFIVDRLRADGHQVKLMIRHGLRDRPDVEYHAAILSPDTDYSPLLRDADALVHAAFDHVPGRYRFGEGDDLQGFLRANLFGSLALLTAARNLGVQRAVILSSRAVYGRQAPGAVLTEDIQTAPDTHYGAVKSALEAFASSLARQDGWPVCALRPTGIYGVTTPVDKSKWYGLVGDMLSGLPGPARGGTEVHGADVAAAINLLLAASEEAVAGQAFNCSDLYVTTRDIAAIVRDRSGHTIDIPHQPDDAGRFNAMDCTRLTGLGMVFGGEPLFRRTVEDLTDHHLDRRDRPAQLE